MTVVGRESGCVIVDSSSMRDANSMNYNVFISYESKGLGFAKNLYTALKKAGYSVFLDCYDMHTTPNWLEQARMVIENCKCFICILTTDDGPTSKNVLSELKVANDLEKKGLLSILLFEPARFDRKKWEEAMSGAKDVPRLLKKRLIEGSYFVFENAADLVDQVVRELTNLGPVSPLLAGEAVAGMWQAGIERVFKSRRADGEKLAREIAKQIKDSTEIRMMGNSLRDFFCKNAPYWGIVDESLKKQMPPRYMLLLLNPLSPAAKDRAIVENGLKVEDDRAYLECGVFKDAFNTAEYVIEKIKEGKDIQVKFSSVTPTFYMIRTDRYTFVESYHMGQLAHVGVHVPDDDINMVCIGGYMPVFMVKNDSTFGCFLKSHFDFLWNKGDWITKLYKELEQFKKNPIEYRRKQFIEEFLSKGKHLVGRDWLSGEFRSLI